MIQRIQSFYLFLVGILMCTMLFMPLANYFSADGVWQFKPLGVYTMGDPAQMVIPAWPVAIVISLIAIIAFASVFLFTNRRLQMKLCVYNVIFKVALYGVFFLYWWICKGDLAATSSTLAPALVIPVVGIILDYMSYRKINADEQLVRSADRIR